MMLLKTKEMKLLFWFSKSKTEHYGTIKLSVTIDAKESQLTTGIKVHRREWQGNLKRFKEPERNLKLKKLEIEVEKLLDYMTSAGVEITANSLTETYKKLKFNKLEPTAENLRKLNEPEGEKYTALAILDWYINFRKPDIELDTWKAYLYRRKKFATYLHENKKTNLLAEKFDGSDMTLFFDYLKSLGLSRNRIDRYCITIKKAFNEAEKRRMIIHNQIRHIVYGKDNKQDLRHLELHQLHKLEKLDIRKFINTEYDNLEGLTIARDLFVFSCYTGFHSVDRLNLSVDNIAGDMLIGTRSKTECTYQVKILPKAQEIIFQYGGIDKLPKMDKDTMNEHLKRIEQMAGLKIGLSTKIGRKTFAHLSLNEWDIDKDTLAAAMGLSSPRHITAYGDINAKRVRDKYNNIK